MSTQTQFLCNFVMYLNAVTGIAQKLVEIKIIKKNCGWYYFRFGNIELSNVLLNTTTFYLIAPI